MPPKRKRTSSGAASTKAAPAVTEPSPSSPPAATSDDQEADFGSSHHEDEDDSDATPFQAADTTAATIDCPFKVEYISSKKPRGKKSKKASATPTVGPRAGKRRRMTADVIGTNGAAANEQDMATAGSSIEPIMLGKNYPEDIGTIYAIQPKKEWDELRKYRNFVVGNEHFALNEYIFVNHQNIPHNMDLENVDDTNFWVARVLEIRARDEAHVYLRVFWLYWPDELPGGRQYYHGKRELVASNHMEIIDAMTVSGQADVKHWLELDEDEDVSDLFWRQRYDIPSKILGEVREHCKCHRYYNPDNTMFFCPHCKTWLHEECVAEEIKKRVIAGTLKPPTAEDLAAKEAENGEETTPKRNVGRKPSKSLLSTTVDTFAPETPTAPEKEDTNTTSKKAPNDTTGKKRGRKPKNSASPEMEQVEVEFMPEEGKELKAIIKDMRPKLSTTAGADDDQPPKTPVRMPRGAGKSKTAAAAPVKDKESVVTWEIVVNCLLCDKIVT